LSTHQAAIFSYSLIALSFVWVTLFGAWRSYRARALRDELETLRVRLFDLIMSGQLSAASPVVQHLNMLLEAAARQSGMMTFARFLLASVALRGRLLTPRPAPTWDCHAELGNIYAQMRILIARHVISGCPLLWIFLPAILAACRARPLSAEWATGAQLIPGFVVLDTLLVNDRRLKATASQATHETTTSTLAPEGSLRAL